MNLRVAIYLPYEGDAEELQPFLSDLADLLVAHGYGNVAGEAEYADDQVVKSVIIGKNFDLPESEVAEYLDTQFEDAFVVVMPVIPQEETGAS